MKEVEVLIHSLVETQSGILHAMMNVPSVKAPELAIWSNYSSPPLMCYSGHSPDTPPSQFGGCGRHVRGVGARGKALLHRQKLLSRASTARTILVYSNPSP